MNFKDQQNQEAGAGQLPADMGAFNQLQETNTQTWHQTTPSYHPQDIGTTLNYPNPGAWVGPSEQQNFPNYGFPTEPTPNFTYMETQTVRHNQDMLPYAYHPQDIGTTLNYPNPGAWVGPSEQQNSSHYDFPTEPIPNFTYMETQTVRHNQDMLPYDYTPGPPAKKTKFQNAETKNVEWFYCQIKGCKTKYQLKWKIPQHMQHDHSKEFGELKTARDLAKKAHEKRDFALAHKHYDAAIALTHKTPTDHRNKAAVYFEEGKFEDCIKEYEKAIEIGREVQAKSQQIAEEMARIGDAYEQLENLKDALKWYGESLSEFHDPAIVKKHKQVEKDLKDAERFDPEIAEQEKQQGNDSFQKGDYSGAMEHYNEAIKRNPDNAVLYSNRAACYQKLMEFHKCIEDCDTALKKDPNCAEAHCLQGKAHKNLYIQAFKKAKLIDPNNKEIEDEMRRISSDPSMQLILEQLEQMSQDPKAVQEPFEKS